MDNQYPLAANFHGNPTPVQSRAASFKQDGTVPAEQRMMSRQSTFSSTSSSNGSGQWEAMVMQMMQQNPQLMAEFAQRMAGAFQPPVGYPPQVQAQAPPSVASPPPTPAAQPAQTSTPQPEPETTGHTYGETIIMGDARVMQGDLHDGDVPPKKARKHLYKKTIMQKQNKANLFQGDSTTKRMKDSGFWDRSTGGMGQGSRHQGDQFQDEPEEM
ncbi:hypothetical protein OHC33_003353 [Knufia fluminis]|uniref:Uncharacterized protein n=1 Tax=Knufia fluminis TaxID=191047 RepID=A0AAN8I5M0_9EURO|nr:hypothetical protein OHC33_003353 [Knufia fluminis]